MPVWIKRLSVICSNRFSRVAAAVKHFPGIGAADQSTEEGPATVGLGLEAARELLTHGCEVHLVHLGKFLMEQQLDPEAAAILKRNMEAMGVQVHLEKSTTAVLGGHVDFACNNAPTVIPQAKAGRLRALFVTPVRIQDLPDAPQPAFSLDDSGTT